MAAETGIEWCDATINFWQGCEKVSTGCKNCYMYREMARWGKDGKNIVRVSDKTIQNTLKRLEGTQSDIFTCSYSDFFIKQADEWRPYAWKIIKEHPEHNFLILTKHPERIIECLPPDWPEFWGYKNVWIGISAENQETYDQRIEHLMNVPVIMKFVSLEPLLGPIDLRLRKMFGIDGGWSEYGDNIKWVIVGGESGHGTGKFKARPMEISWVDDIMDQFRGPIFVKQVGTVAAKKHKISGPAGTDHGLPKRKPSKK